jgi:hypothetical protein
LREGININLSLSTLSQVISALSKKSKDVNNKEHVRFRDSKLTHLLQDSLGGNSATTLIATVSPSSDAEKESFNTLSFANTARAVKLDVTQNLSVNGRQVDAVALQKRLETILSENQKLRSQQSVHEEVLAQTRALGAEEGAAILSLLETIQTLVEQGESQSEVWEALDAQARSVLSDLEEHYSELLALADARLEVLQGELAKAREQIAALESTASLSEAQTAAQMAELAAAERTQRQRADEAEQGLEASNQRVGELEQRVKDTENKAEQAAAEAALQLASLEATHASASAAAQHALEAAQADAEMQGAQLAQVREELAAEQQNGAQLQTELQEVQAERQRLLVERESTLAAQSARAQAERQKAERQGALCRDAAGAFAARKAAVVSSASTPAWASAPPSAALALFDESLLLSASEEKDPLREAEMAALGVMRSTTISAEQEQEDIKFRAMLAHICAAPLMMPASASFKSPSRAGHRVSSTPLKESLSQAQAKSTPLGALFASAAKQRQSLSPASTAADSWSLVLDPVARAIQQQQRQGDHADFESAPMSTRKRPSMQGVVSPAPMAGRIGAPDSTPSRMFR